MGREISEEREDETGQVEKTPAPSTSTSSSDDDLRESVQEVTVRVVQEQIGRLIRQEMTIVREEIRSELHIGPLPHQATLRAYEEIFSGAAGIIFNNFDEQGKHRRALESYALKSNTWRSFAGLSCGFVVSLAFLFVSYDLIQDGHGWEGTVLGSFDLVGLVGVFVYGSHVLRDERVRKANIMTGQSDSDRTAKDE